MDNLQDFALEPEDQEPVGETPAAPPPIVVIEYRNRGLPAKFVAPVIILLAAVAILSYRRHTPIRALAWTAAPASQGLAKSAPRTIRVDSPSTGVAFEPIVVRADPAPEPEVPVAPVESVTSQAEPAGASALGPRVSAIAAPRIESPKESDTTANASSPPAGVAAGDAPFKPAANEPKPSPPRAPERSVAIAAPPPTPEPEVTKEQFWADVLRESAEKKAEARRLEEMKPHLKAIERAESLRRSQASRIPFHNDLRTALRTLSAKEIGDEIESLCNQYGRSTLPEIKEQVNMLLRRSHARVGRQVRVEMMRTCGLPEPMILDYLAHDIARNMNTRGGPRDDDQVLVRAAQLLLKMPPAPVRDSSSNDSSPRSTPKPFADAVPSPVRGASSRAQ